MSKKIFLKNKDSKNHSQAILDSEAIKLFEDSRLQHLIIIVLFRRKKLPKYCTPMLRHPSPKVDVPLNGNLAEIYFSAIFKNPSIEDGVVLVQSDCPMPILRGFSYRVYPPPLDVLRLRNMGSGYNSSLDFSSVKRIICVYLINGNGVKKFINGKEKILC